MHGGREQNYWPGFVDALSNVVLTLLFVIVVFVFALALGMNRAVNELTAQAEAKVQAQAQAQKQTEAGQHQAEVSEKLAEENKALQQRLTQAEREAARLRAELEEVTIAVQDEAPAKTPTSSAGVQVTGDRIIITYPLSIADLDSKAGAELERALERFRKRAGKGKITIRSIPGAEPFSAAQRYAYYRAINIRNTLIAKGVAASSQISSVIAGPQGEGGGRVEIGF